MLCCVVDEEFNPDELSASDVAEEWDTDYQSSTSEDEEGGEKGEGGEKKKEKKARRAVTIVSDSKLIKIII